MFHCRAQTIIKIALAIVAPFFGTVFLVTQGKGREGKQSPGGSLNAYSKEMYKARHSWEAAFLFDYFLLHEILGVLAEEFLTELK